MKHRHGSGDPECRAIFERLSEYLDGELPPALCDEVDGHLGDCTPCVAFLESLRRTVRLIETTESPRLPDDVRRSLAAAYRRFRSESGR